MTTIAVTGCSGYLGARLLDRLENDVTIRRIVGIDIAPPKVHSTKLTLHLRDIRSHDLGRLLRNEDVDIVVHLAAIVDPIHDTRQMHDINVRGTSNICEAAARAQARQLVIAGSSSAFGAFADNPARFTESSATRAHPTFGYAAHKHAIEALVSAFERKHPEMNVAIIRPCIIYGPNVDNYLSRFLLDFPVVLDIDGANVEMQCVHEDDVARVFHRVIERGVGGRFHAVGQGTLRLRDIAALMGKRTAPVPAWAIRPLIAALWHSRSGLIEGPPGMLDFLRYPWVLDDAATLEALELSPNRTTPSVFEEMLRTHD